MNTNELQYISVCMRESYMSFQMTFSYLKLTKLEKKKTVSQNPKTVNCNGDSYDYKINV